MNKKVCNFDIGQEWFGSNTVVTDGGEFFFISFHLLYFLFCTVVVVVIAAAAVSPTGVYWERKHVQYFGKKPRERRRNEKDER